MAGGYQTWPLVQFNVIGEAWRQYKRHWVVWSLTIVIVMVCFSAAFGIGMAVVGGRGGGAGGVRLPLSPAAGIVPFMLSAVVSAFLVGGMVRMASNQLRGGAPRIEDLFSVVDCWFDLLLTGVLYAGAIALGNLLCVFPGLIAFGLFMLAVPLVVEGRLPATGALIQSWNSLKSQWLTATIFHLFLSLVAVSGTILCGIGFFLTAPLYSIAIAILYRDFYSASAFGGWQKEPKPIPEL
jgi:uncharacterized membrane protein